MPKRIPITPKGLAKLRAELKQIREVERPQNVADIEEARGHGDLKENAEYHAAKDRQAYLDARMKDLEGRTALAEVIDPTTLSGDRVVFGATVTLEDTDTGDESVYIIVGEDESDAKRGRISVASPIARALIGHHVDDCVKVRVPGGLREYDIIEVVFEAID